MLPFRIAKTVLMGMPNALVKSPVSQTYEAAKMAFARFDYEVSFAIDRFRRAQMRSQRFAQIERELGAKIASFDDLMSSASNAEKVQLQSQRSQLEWVLAQVRGEANGSGVVAQQPRRQSPLEVLSSVLSARRGDAAMPPRSDPSTSMKSLREEIPID